MSDAPLDFDKLVADVQTTEHPRWVEAFNKLAEVIDSGRAPDTLGDRLAPLAERKEGWIRERGIRLLAALKKEAVLPVLEAHAADAEPEVRAAVEDVAEDLGEAGRPLLRQLVKDSDLAVRFWAAAALAEAQIGDGYEVLVEGLATTATRFEALQGLRRLGDRRAEPSVRKVMGKWFLPALDRVAGEGVLASFGDAGAKERLVKELTRRRSDVRGLAMEMVGEMKLSEGLPVLEAVAKDPGDDHRGAAVMALGSTRDDRYLERLAGLLRDTALDPDLRADAAWALHLLGTEAAQAVLKEAAASEKHATVAEELRYALEAGPRR